ncbi:MAG: hypothetical protein mread185_000656 [Mycoplasmataceae bacterium]|nr:MAG: hypothetical protein mread185_000656 [Mycoplasmataceae bacterium]
MNELLKNNKAMEDLRKIIDANSKFLRHVEGNIINEQHIYYYLGSQGYWRNRRSQEKFDFSLKCIVSCRYTDVYTDIIFSLREVEKDEDYEKIEPQRGIGLPNKENSNLIIEDKLALLGIMFSKNTDNRFIDLICEKKNHLSKSLEFDEKIGIKKAIEWIVKKISKIQEFDKQNKYFAINEKDILIVINSNLWSEAISKEILGELNLKYFEKFIIIDLPLKNNFQCVILNKRSLGYHYEILNDAKEETYREKDFFSNSEKFYFHIDSKLFFFPFVNSYALLESKE